MDFISTKELSKKWNISTTRITIMANKGQLPGAKLIGKSWMFPVNIEKPIDGRYKNTNTISKEKFHYPIFTLNNYDSSELSTEEYQFYQIEKKFNSMNYEYAFNEFNNILNTTNNTTLKLGSLYHLCLSGCMLEKYDEVIKYYHVFKILLTSDIPYKTEMEILFYNLYAHLESNNNYEANSYKYLDADESCAQELALGLSYRMMITIFFHETPVNFEHLELVTKIFNDTDYPLTSIYSNIHLGLMYGIKQNYEMKYRHIKKAILSAIKYEYYFPIAIYYNFFGDIAPMIEKEFPAKLLKIFKENNTLYLKTNADLKEKLADVNLPSLTIEDYEYLGYLYKGLNSTTIAKNKNISEKTVFNRYQSLRVKLNAKNKKDLLDKYKNYIIYSK